MLENVKFTRCHGVGRGGMDRTEKEVLLLRLLPMRGEVKTLREEQEKVLLRKESKGAARGAMASSGQTCYQNRQEALAQTEVEQV